MLTSMPGYSDRERSSMVETKSDRGLRMHNNMYGCRSEDCGLSDGKQSGEILEERKYTRRNVAIADATGGGGEELRLVWIWHRSCRKRERSG